jgi:hypothetical protein
MQDAEVSGVEYQQGELAGYEVREYLLEKWHRRCAYCGKTDVPLEIEHIIPKSRGGSNRISKLTLACHRCNERKGNQTAAEFGHPEVQQQAKQPLKDAAAVNSTRWALYHRLEAIGLPVEVGTGGRTKWNRTRRDLPKTHWLDVACVGASTPETLLVHGVTPLEIKATGHGHRRMCKTDAHGFPIPTAHRASKKAYFGFQTGVIARAIKRTGQHVGAWTGRLVVNARGQFGPPGANARKFTVSYNCFLIKDIQGL